MATPLKVCIIAGEESGDILGADLVVSLRNLSARRVELTGVGGKHLTVHGLDSLFDPSEIALMGISAILTKVPRLYSLINKTVASILAQKPDCLVIIDSPEFCHRVARKVRAAEPSIPIVNYVCPSVWAWRPARAKAMSAYVDHVLAILPFEPHVLRELSGPPATYVGHRLSQDSGIQGACNDQIAREPLRRTSDKKTLLVLPGSRRSEVKRHMPVFGETLSILRSRGLEFTAVLPVTSNVEENVRALSANWGVRPEIVTSSADKLAAFASSDVALAASGTVTLELALSRVPFVSCYKFDPIAKILSEMLVTSWTASLPNLIADTPVVPEFYNQFVRAPMLARQIESLLSPSAKRTAMLDGFTQIASNLITDFLPGEKSAEIVLSYAEQGR